MNTPSWLVLPFLVLPAAAQQMCPEPVEPSNIGQDIGHHSRTDDQVCKSIDLIRCLGMLCMSPELLGAASDLDGIKDSGGLRGEPLPDGQNGRTGPDTSTDPTDLSGSGTINCWSRGGDNAILIQDGNWHDPSGGTDPSSELQWGSNQTAGDADLASLLLHEYSHRVADEYEFDGDSPRTIDDLLAFNFFERVAHEIQKAFLCKVIALPANNPCINLTWQDRGDLQEAKENICSEINKFPII